MFAFAFDAALARRHAPLVEMAAAIAGGLREGTRAVPLRDADAAEREDGRAAGRDAADRRGVTLVRGRQPAIRREGKSGSGALTLSYDHPASEAALAALLACAASLGSPGGAPIAADAESLSVLALAERLAASDIPVLINGPTGTGKEVLSRFIHDRSPRSRQPFIAINCAAMPESMLEALLFGHAKGAFTGASAASEGFFRAADGGTLLLDEIAEMPLSLQAKLLRALQEGEVTPIGATSAIKVDVRVIACANRDLPTEVAENRFRADLYYRLNVFPLQLLPLRERTDDIAPLAFALALRHTADTGRTPWIGDAALAMLRHHGWPGNVRELENVVRRALLLAGDGPAITPAHIVFDRPARLVAGSVAGGGGLAADRTDTVVTPLPTAARKLSNIVQLSEARAIMATLADCGGSRTAAARQLGISERTLRYRLAAFREAGLTVAVPASDVPAMAGVGA